MANGPFVKNFDELLMNLRDDIQNGESIFYIARENEDSIFEKLLVQDLKREIDGKETNFLAIRSITLKENFKGQGSFKKFFAEFDSLGVNLIFHDVVNERLFNFLLKQGYMIFKEKKYEDELISCYKLSA